MTEQTTVFTPPRFASIPAELKALPRWVCWRAEQKPGEKKPRKVPYNARTLNRKASSTDPATWATFGEAHAAYSERMGKPDAFTGVGLCLNGDGLAGVDLDDVITDGAIAPDALALLERLQCRYIERSPSGQGLRAFGYAPKLESGAAGVIDGMKAELYSTGRYLTLTGDTIKAGPLGELEGFAELAERVRSNKPGTPAPPARTEASASHAPQLPEVWASEETLRDLRSALASMRSDDRAIWIDMGHALKTLGDRGRGLWIEWGQTSEKWKPEDARLWDGFNPTKTSWKAVFTRAEQFGWVNPARKVQSLPEVDFAGLLSRDTGQVDPDTGEILSAPFTPPPPPPTAGAGFDAIGYPPGLVGDVARYIFQSARMPIHSFSVAGALTVLAHLNANGAWVGASDTGLNIYHCLTGKSGAGKDGPRNSIKRIVCEVAKRAPLQPALMCSMTEGYSSGPALLRALSVDKMGLMMTDEFGMFLQSAAAEGNTHLKDLVREMMALWGSSRSFHAGKRYADSKFDLEPVHCPYLSVLGTTTPTELSAAITSKQVDNGFLNRILFIPASEVNPVNHAPDTRIAPALVARLVELTARPAGPIEYSDGDTWRAMIQAGEQLTEPGEFEALWTRAPEMCIRLAGLLALGDGGRITPEHVRWAASYVRWSIKGFAVFLGDDMAESQFQRNISRARHAIRNARQYGTDKQFGALCKKGILPRGKLTKLMKVPSRELDDVVRHLVESGQVAQVEGGFCALA